MEKANSTLKLIKVDFFYEKSYRSDVEVGGYRWGIEKIDK